MNFHLSCVEQCSKLRQCRPKNFLLKFHPARKANRRLSETTLPWPHGPCCPPSLAGSADHLVFRLVARGNTLVRPHTVIIVELARTVGRVSEVLEAHRVGAATFGALALFVAAPTRRGSGAPAAVFRGGGDYWVLAAAERPHAVGMTDHGGDRRVIGGSYLFSGRGGQTEEKHCHENFVVLICPKR